MARPKTSAFVGASLDGFLARPDGRVDWLDPYGGEEHGFTAFFATVDTLAIGRNTYAFVESMVAKGIPWMYEGKRCVVLTHRPLEAKFGERAFAGTPAQLLGELEAEGAKHVYVDGGVVVRAFIAAGLLDELTVSFVPCLIGEGMPLFGGVALESGIKLDGTSHYQNGIVQMRYRFPSS